MDRVKQVIVVRTDLNMRKGKIAAQVAHASLGVLLKSPFSLIWYFLCKAIGITLNKTPLQKWLTDKFTKICVSCNSEIDLITIVQLAKDLNVPHCLITDAGLTEFKGVPTKTCAAFGPYYESDINKITGHLKLL